jgi:hypothetical protein
VLWLAVFLTASATPFASSLISADGDFALHVTLGEGILEAGGLLPRDPTAAEATRPYVDFEWGAQVLFALAHRAAGLAGPVLLVAALVATTLWCVLAWARREGAGPWPAFLVLGAVILVARLHLLARPHVFTWALLVPALFLLSRYRRGDMSWWAWVLPSCLLMVAWVNLHGGFLVAFAVGGLTLTGESIAALRAQGEARRASLRRCGGLAVGGLTIFFASALNPYGFGLHLHLLGVLTSGTEVATAEFAPPDLGQPAVALAVGLCVAGAGALLWNARRSAPAELVLALGLLALSFQAARHAPLFALAVGPWVARSLEEALAVVARRDGALGRAAAAVRASSERLVALEDRLGGWLSAALLAMALGACAVAYGLPWIRFDPERLPVRAAAYLAEHPRMGDQRLLNTFRWGGYLTYELHPPLQSFVNGLTPNFPPEVLEAYARLEAASPGWERELERRGIRLVVFAAEAPLSQALAAHPDWEELHRDPVAVVFQRREAR